MNFVESSLADLEQRNLRRRREVTEHLAGQLIQRSGQTLINFGSNDYLGLRAHPQVVKAAYDALQSEGVGSGASPAVTGYSSRQRKLEQRLAAFQHMPDGLVFSSGFSGSLATITSLVDGGDVIFSDGLNHASLIDGCRLSKATKEIYPHCNVDWLAQRLALVRHQFSRALIVTESIFSMDGDAAPLVQIASLAERYDCGLIVDEAHATGIYGHTGAGLVDELGLSGRVLAKLGTLSKAIGCVGGFVCGSNAVIEHILNFGRSYMFSTALPGSVLAAAAAAVNLIETMATQRNALRQSSVQLRSELRGMAWQILGDDSPILPLMLGEEGAALTLSEQLQSKGLFVPAIRPPTVPAGTSRLRISLSCEHTASQVGGLVNALTPPA